MPFFLKTKNTFCAISTACAYYLSILIISVSFILPIHFHIYCISLNDLYFIYKAGTFYSRKILKK